MKKRTTLELVEQSEQVSLYSISFAMDCTTEFERYFRPEGNRDDNLCALPIESGKIRLYCLRISDEVLILGNGDVKSSATYEETPKLFGYALDLQKFDALLQKDINDGIVTIEEKQLTHIEDREYYI